MVLIAVGCLSALGNQEIKVISDTLLNVEKVRAASQSDFFGMYFAIVHEAKEHICDSVCLQICRTFC